jgi:tyrosinase
MLISKPPTNTESQIDSNSNRQALTTIEKSNYIKATLCLTETPAKHGIPGAKTLWDELHYVHIYQSAYIHFTGAFLQWHRYHLAVHSKLLTQDCGYHGPMPHIPVSSITPGP